MLAETLARIEMDTQIFHSIPHFDPGLTCLKAGARFRPSTCAIKPDGFDFVDGHFQAQPPDTANDAFSSCLCQKSGLLPILPGGHNEDVICVT